MVFSTYTAAMAAAMLSCMLELPAAGERIEWNDEVGKNNRFYYRFKVEQ